MDTLNFLEKLGEGDSGKYTKLNPEYHLNFIV
jgi:hypothetical protein